MNKKKHISLNEDNLASVAGGTGGSGWADSAITAERCPRCGNKPRYAYIMDSSDSCVEVRFMCKEFDEVRMEECQNEYDVRFHSGGYRELA